MYRSSNIYWTSRCVVATGTFPSLKLSYNIIDNGGSLLSLPGPLGGLRKTLKAKSHCSDNENNNDYDAKGTHSIGWNAPRRVTHSHSTNRGVAFFLTGPLLSLNKDKVQQYYMD